ncbi:MAG: type restriction endonuclease [Segetibacter sp.]|nr:type restriction endonuclease [Segetibacter sp.]
MSKVCFNNNAFEWRFEFPEVLDDEGDFAGFDMVIGNPTVWFLDTGTAKGKLQRIRFFSARKISN